MRVGVVGAGAIGGYIAVTLARAGHDVSIVARGQHLSAIQARGLRVLYADGSEHIATALRASGQIAALGTQDVIILAVKSHQVAPLADELAAVLCDKTMLVTMQNGIPWWYFQRHGGEHEARHIEAVDPAGVIARTIDPGNILGCVVYPAATIEAPGIIRHVEGTRFPLGELDGANSARVTRLAEAFSNAGLKSPVLDNIRAEIWLKLWGNLSFNPISALTHATLVDMCQFDLSRELALGMMKEAQVVAGKLGIHFRVPVEKRIAGAEKVGKHKTSMLQDVEAGRDPEIDALLGAVLELGRLTGETTPCMSTLYALVKLLSKTINEARVCVRATPLPLTV